MYKICVSSKIDLVSRFLNRSKAKEREVGIEEQKYAREHEVRKRPQKIYLGFLILLSVKEFSFELFLCETTIDILSCRVLEQMFIFPLDVKCLIRAQIRSNSL